MLRMGLPRMGGGNTMGNPILLWLGITCCILSIFNTLCFLLVKKSHSLIAALFSGSVGIFDLLLYFGVI